MNGSDLVYFDIAAVIVMLVSLGSFLLRRKTKTPANRVYLSVLSLMFATACVALAAEVYDKAIITFLERTPVNDLGYPPMIRGAIQLAYYALRSLTAPAYLVLIATVSDTSHRLNRRSTRAFLWIPMLATLALVLTNPLHHLVFAYQDGTVVRGPGVMALYASTLYYSLIGVAWLFRWKLALNDDEFSTLMMQYPLVLLAVYIQYFFPHLHIEMFASSVALMLVSAFVMRPELTTDSLVAAASLQAYRDMIHRAFLTQKPLCLVYLEMVNRERLSELVGKEEFQYIVRQVAANLTASLEEGDILYYLRGGLFCISSVNLDGVHALHVAERTHAEGKRRAPDIPGQPSHTPAVSMRACVVRTPQDVSDLDTLSTFVHRFAHLVPESRVTSFAELSQQSDFALNMALSSCISRAISERSFEVYYQPIYCLTQDCFRSAEALVRLNDPDFGFISPALFIPEAEQSGAILEIGAILLDKICAFLGSELFDTTGLAYVEVNLSTEQCVRPQMASELLEMLEAHHVDPARMNLEITETSATYAQSTVEHNMRTLAKVGLTFSLDDYGTGYSNLTRVLNLPFELVKLDKSFADGMGDETIRTVLERTIAMMKSIGKKVLVEGVETNEQAEALRAMGADYIQGYLYSRPLAQDDFVTFLKAHNKR